MRWWSVAGGLTLIAASGLGAQQVPGPSFRQVLELRSVGSPAIAPDGRSVAYTVRSANWADNRYDSEVWLWREGRGAIQLTRTPKGGSSSPAWSPDGRWIGFLADRGDGRQLYVISPDGGEALKLTWRIGGVSDFAWAPDSRRVALLIQDQETGADKTREKLYGDYAVEDHEYRQSHLWVMEVDPTRWSPDTTTAPKPARLTEGGAFTVSNFAWSPDGSRIAFERRHDPMITSGPSADVMVVSVASRAISPLVERTGSDGNPLWSPDGQWVLFGTDAGDTTSNFYRNNQIAKVPAAGGAPVRLAADFDENIGGLSWSADGIRFVAWQKTGRDLFRIDPATGSVTPIATPGLARVYGYDVTADGGTVVVAAQADSSALTELYRISGGGAPERITDMTGQIAGWNVGTSTVVSWKSRDGTVIEGVLQKPADFDPAKRYPLLVVIHGGPTGIDTPGPVPFYVYPIPEFVAKGALVLRPNYRGSAGYGEKFRSLNVRNLGVGDYWDVMSGVDNLVRQGFVDTTRMGAMGWSQGGYISAFLTTNTSRFKAISVGAGISNWITYYVATDITPFTRQYLKATPWQDRAIYDKTSPMTTITKARTPTLIQHGEFDHRVPTQNGLELYQGLLDQGVPTELIIYKGFGHGITKPKEQLAATWHNWIWFSKYLWGEQVEMPLEEPAGKAGS